MLREMLRSAGHALLARPFALGVLTLLLALSPLIGLPFVWMTRVLVGFVVLMRGAKSGGIVLGWSLLPALSLGIAVHWSLCLYLCVLGLFAWGSAVVLRLWQRWETVLECMALLGVCIVAGVHVYFSDVSALWLRLFEQFLQIWKTAAPWGEAGVNIDMSYRVFLSQVATGVQVSIMLGTTLLHLLLARFWQQCCNEETPSLKASLYSVKLGYTLGVLFVLFLVGGMAGSAFLMDGIPVLFFCFLLAGMSVFHAVMATSRHGVWGHICLYTLMMFFFPYIMIGLAGFGWIDVWFHCRKRLIVWKSFY